ncbi:MAG: hypothetical protein Ta2B_10120 [Termitinemataceae bacterium]|nr:MAG: hypothetical protein Ta2B_10120 [Termitinemataceae bacterium]
MIDMPYAIEDAELLSELGYNLVEKENGDDEWLMCEREYRYFFTKYTKYEFVTRAMTAFNNIFCRKQESIATYIFWIAQK